jgi:hypothetical protein
MTGKQIRTRSYRTYGTIFYEEFEGTALSPLEQAKS